MLFNEFVQKLAIVLKAGSNTSAFTRSIFEEIIPEDRLYVLDEYKASSYKAFYNGSSPINKISSKINGFADPVLFDAYICEQEDAAVEKLCDIFFDDLPEIDTDNAGKLIGELFSSIITEAASTNKKSAPKDAKPNSAVSGALEDGVVPELTPENADKVFILSQEIDDAISDALSKMEDEVSQEFAAALSKMEDEDSNPFSTYLDAAVSYYSTKKTLLYAEKPHPFYELYVCNDVRYRKFHAAGYRDTKDEITIHNATISSLEAESDYIIIEGTGGIGKSMFLTHLFLSSADKASAGNKIPLLLFLKNYTANTNGLVDFIWESVKEFDPDIDKHDIIDALRKRQIILLLDGLDEIQTGIRDNFYSELESFIKAYPENNIVMTSRPIDTFTAFTKFSVFDIKELSKPQAIELVQKLEFWDEEAKRNFLVALDQKLYYSHYQFASNPLLLTIMLMTYSSFGEVPAKMHVFYSKAYETMARLHDASKGSFKRSLHTGLTPEEFSKYFAQFCARTYEQEVFEFNFMSFSRYMEKVLKDVPVRHRHITPNDFLLDLTDNLCIMYKEGDKYYFIHRSFQEYFAAVYFATVYDDKLEAIGDFFENTKHRSYTDKTFEMLCDMIPEKIERFIFLPYMEKLITDCSKKNDAYWEFLERIYPIIHYEVGETDESYFNTCSSFLYETIIQSKSLEEPLCAYDHEWPPEIDRLTSSITWVKVYKRFLDPDAFDDYPDPDLIPEEILDNTCYVNEDCVPDKYERYFGSPDYAGTSIEINIHQLRQYPDVYAVLREHMEQEDFPLYKEYRNVKEYYYELAERIRRKTANKGLFDD